MRILEKIYHIVPYKKQIFILIRSITKLPHSIYKHLHFKGVYNVKIDENSSFKINHYGYEIENEIFWCGLQGGWEKQSIKLWIELCKISEVILDIGANTGLYALIAKSANPTSRVYALEPVERVFKKLIENVNLNNFEIVCSPLAASNKDGDAVIYDIPGTDHIYSVTVNKNIHNSDTPVVQTPITTIKLDTFVEHYNLPKVDLIKIDVETHEPEVIEGYANYIAAHKPTLLIEILNDEVGASVEGLVRELGYLYFNIDENKGIRQVSKILKSDYYNYLLCAPNVARHLHLI